MIVLRAEEMILLEEKAVAGGYSQEDLMRNAGSKVALVACKRADPQRKILLLIGKGNKGGDAFVAGMVLLQKGFSVHAFTLYPPKETSPLAQKMCALFEKQGGQCFSQDLDLSSYGLIIDGILGTGFRGTLPPDLARFIEEINRLPVPRISIDLPSGLNPTTGEGADQAIQASVTVALGAAKSGCFLRDGWNCVGELLVEDIGIAASYFEQADLFATLAFPPHLKLPRLIRNRHKYQAGYVVGYGGSALFSGAAKLSSLAALRSGAGIVRLFHPKEAEPAMEHAFPELIHGPWNEAMWLHELQRASALFIGPGLGPTLKLEDWLKVYVAPITQPCVLDADALVPDSSCWPKRVVLTPHRQEALRLLGRKTPLSDEDLLKECQELCDRTEAVMVLKGAPTFVFGPKKTPMIIPYGDPGMATAGAGDVLTGIIASFLSQKLSCWDAAVLGATLHALAGERAAAKKSSYAMIASDLIEELAQVSLWTGCVGASPQTPPKD